LLFENVLELRVFLAMERHQVLGRLEDGKPLEIVHKLRFFKLGSFFGFFEFWLHLLWHPSLLPIKQALELYMCFTLLANSINVQISPARDGLVKGLELDYARLGRDERVEVAVQVS
jgi:hypothetical protein